MKFNPLTKSIFKTLFIKMTRLEHRLPAGEKERIYYLRDLCRTWNRENAEISEDSYFVSGTEPEVWLDEAADFGIEEYIKLNYVLLTIIWFSNNSYDSVLQIEALENIVREYRKTPAVEEYIGSGDDIINCLQMLARNYVENPDCPDELIRETLREYDEKLGPDERLAFADEHLNYLAMRGEFGDLSQLSAALISLPKGNYSDCYACIINRLVRWHMLTGDFQEASVLIDKIFADRLTCDLIPHTTKVQKVVVGERLGQKTGGTKSAEKTALKNLAPRDAMIYEASFLLTYAVHTGNTVLAQAVLSRFEPIIRLVSSPEKVYYCLAAYRASGERVYYDTGLALAKRFDARNGTPFYESMFNESKCLNKTVPI